MRLLLQDKSIVDGLEWEIREYGAIDIHTPLSLAVQTDSPELVRLLCDNGAIFATAEAERCSTVVEQACVEGKPKALEALVSCRSGHIDLQPSHLFRAAEHLHSDTVDVLLKNGLNVNARTPSEKMSCLHLVVIAMVHYHCHGCCLPTGCSSLNTVKILLNHGADLYARDFRGNNIYHHAPRCYPRIRRLCLEALFLDFPPGSQAILLETPNRLGETAVHTAIRVGNQDF